MTGPQPGARDLASSARWCSPIPPPLAGAVGAMLTDDQDRRVVLIELRLTPGARADDVIGNFDNLFDSVFGATDAPPPRNLWAGITYGAS